MKNSTAKDVRRFLAAFVDVAVDNNVKLLEGCWNDAGGSHCLLGELVHRGGGHVRAWSATWSDQAAAVLGIDWKDVNALTAGWDGDDLAEPFGRIGLWLRARYIRRWERKEGVST